MIPIPAPDTIRQLDQLTVERQGITFEVLMERAGTSATTWLLEKFPEQKNYTIFCGYGNNGGDGLVIARQLAERSKIVTVYLLEGAGKATDAFTLNLQRLKEQLKARIIPVTTSAQLELPGKGEMIIEAIFGNGIIREPEGLPLEVIRSLNSVTNTVVSIDVPGGMLPAAVTATDKCIHADYTLAFQFPRLPFFFPETGNLCGNWVLLNIQLEEDPQVVAGDKFYMTEPADLAYWTRPRNKFSYKNNFGHALLLAGSKGKCGAAFLAARACLRSGAGLVTVRASQTCSHVLQTSLPEAMVSEDEGKDFLEVPFFPLEYAAIGMGPGIGTDKATGNVLKRLLQDYKGPLVLDADALNLPAENKTWLGFLQPDTILTPHPGEFKRLAEDEKNPFERLQLQKELSKKYHVYIVLKGRYTLTSCPDGTVIINPTGNPGMSTAGSGDVLTGMITAFRAQGYSALAAAVSGVYLHGVAGDKAALQSGENGLIATDLIDQIPMAIRDSITAFQSE